MPSSAVAIRSDRPLTPAMVSTVWEIAAALDEQRVPATVPNAVWLEVPTIRLRGEGSRADNVWLRECLDRLTGVKLSGEYQGDPWGAVVLAEWHITQGGSMSRLLIPPAGVYALRSPSNFTKIEAHAAHRLSGHGRQLYALLADKKRLGRPYWTFTLDELRALMGVDAQKSYSRFNTFRQRVLGPAIEAINDYGTVTVKMTLEKRGRAVHAVRFDWNWKDPRQAAETVAENERHRNTRRRQQDTDGAPPLIADEPQPEPALTWWHGLTQAERKNWADRVGRTFKAGSLTVPRRDADLARAAFSAHEKAADIHPLDADRHEAARLDGAEGDAPHNKTLMR